MMARYFYAFRWAYGIGATWDDGSWPGELYVFDMSALSAGASTTCWGGNDGSQDTH